MTTAASSTMQKTAVDPSTASHCWWIFLQVNQVMVVVAVICLCMQGQKVGDPSKFVKRRNSWCASIVDLGTETLGSLKAKAG